MSRFRKKPVEIEAIRNTGENVSAVCTFMGGGSPVYGDRIIRGSRGPRFYIDTLEGVMCAEVGDWIIRGVAGEFYPCKPDIFDVTYEPVEEDR